MALSEYDKIREAAKRRLEADSQTENDAINRRIAQSGGTNKGAFDKMRVQAQDRTIQNRENVLSDIDVAEAGEERRRQEIGDERAFVSGEAQKGRDFQGSEAQKIRDFTKEFQGSQFDRELAFKKDAMEIQKDQFNRQLGFQWDESNFNKDQVRKQQRSRMMGGLVDPGGALGMGSIGDSSSGLFSGDGSYFCSHMFSQMLINKHEFKELSLLMDAAAKHRPKQLAQYLQNAPAIVEKAKASGFQWADMRYQFVIPILDSMRADQESIALDLYETWLSYMEGKFPALEVAGGN